MARAINVFSVSTRMRNEIIQQTKENYLNGPGVFIFILCNYIYMMVVLI